MLAPLYPIPKASGLDPGVSGGCCGESEKAPFLLWALQPFAGSLRRGQKLGRLLFSPLYWPGLILPNAECHGSSKGIVSTNRGQRLYLNTEWEQSQGTRPPAQ